MHIKKLEISGFKSFVDRTVIHFDHDMIGIVGPNGCGKSNVVDAIRWAMGEQSAKALRGRAMADIIFNGSDTRQPHGFAEVTVTFDNSDWEMAKLLPLEYRDYSEIAVTRRLYRDGTSEYLINKVQVRLRDVTDVFLGTGVGRKAYSIVEQGKIGVIVSARPEDRRLLIEEAAGITKYKSRKRQAEQKMSQTRLNLERVRDIVTEIDRQLGSLKRQAAKARRYLRYREEIDDLLLWEASHRLLELLARTGVVTGICSEARERVSAERAAVDARDAEIEVARDLARRAEQRAESAQNWAFLSDNSVRELENQIERATDQYEHLQERLSRARAEQAEVEAQTGAAVTEREAVAAQLDQVDTEKAREEALVRSEADKLEATQQSSDQAAERLEALRKQDATAAARIAATEARLAGFAQRSAELDQRQDRLGQQLDTEQQQQTQLSDQHEQLRRQVVALGVKQQAMCDARDALRTELPELQQASAAADRSVSLAASQLQRAESRLRALEEIAERLEGVGAGVRSLLKMKLKDPKIAGLIAERVDVPERLTAAFAGLVGERLQCVIVADTAHALQLLGELARQRQGRASVIPRADAPSNGRSPAAASPLSEIGLGLLADQIECQTEDEALVRSLIGEARIVERDEDARLLRSGGVSSDIVTLGGTVFHADGRITGGGSDAVAAGMLEQKQEMRRLRSDIPALTGQLAECEQESARLRERLANLREALDQANQEAHGAEIELVTAKQDLRRMEEQLSRTDKRREAVAQELHRVVADLDRAAAEHVRAEQELTESSANLDEVRIALTAAEAAARSLRAELAQQQQVFTDRKVLFAEVKERARAARSTLERLDRTLEELRDRVATLEADRHGWAVEAGQVAASIFCSRQEVLEARRQAREAQAAFENARVSLDDARHSLGIRESELREMRAKLEEVSRTLQEQELELQRLQLERRHLDEGIAERFRGLELAKVVGDYHARPQMDEQQRARIRELSQLIDRMGSVNLEAMKEHEEAAARYEYYVTQEADLSKALLDLDTAIARMNKESRHRFKHAFNGINRRFIEIFPKLFGGGKAELRLTDPNDLLETGIEILAQPPGKRLGNIELMSGGEKAFTAVSLLLAIFRYKPSPFCILDEVDAPLDETNIGRFVEGIRAMTDRSQFIVITHSKRTMKAVDVLYGVTMQEPGVSKLVGVRVGNGPSRSEHLHQNHFVSRGSAPGSVPGSPSQPGDSSPGGVGSETSAVA